MSARFHVNWDSNELYQIMTKALLEDKMSFVKLLLNQGVSMREYLTVPRLERLYNTLPKQGYLFMLLKRKLGKEEFKIHDIGRFLQDMLERFEDETSRGGSRHDRSRQSSKRKLNDTTDTEAEEEQGQFHRPYKQLLIWAVLLKRPELAKFFWEMGEEPITSALSSSMLCVRMYRIIPKYMHSIRQDFISMKKMFEGLATKVLDECHAVDPERAVMLVERKSPSWSRMTCLQIAAAADDQLFVSSVACQNSVNNVWKNGILSDWKRVFFCTLLPFLILPVIRVTEIEGRPVSQWQKFMTFIAAPITKFTYYMLSYLAFLMTYTYMVLVDFREYPSELEIFLMIWIISFFINEIHTFIVFPSPTFWGKVRDWLGFLNRLELANLLLSFVGFILRYDSKHYMEAKTLYCINIVIFYIRIIKVYVANSHLGPKLYMIFRMVEELIMFMVVLVVFLLAYGVCSQGLLYKRRHPSFAIIKDLVQYPYWQLYGELNLDEILSDTGCLAQQANRSNGSTVAPYDNYCRESYWLVYIMLGLYLLVGNVLLLNLLVAIFSNVFNQVEANSIEIWKYQMYFLVMEFQCKAISAPPLSIIEHIYIFVKFIVSRTCRKKQKVDRFSPYHLVYLALFEKEMMSNYMRCLKSQNMDSVHRRFDKIQKRVDMLIKLIEDKHVEDEMSLQTSHSTDSKLEILRAAVTSLLPVPRSESAAVTPDNKLPSTSGIGPLTAGLTQMAASGGEKGDQTELKKSEEAGEKRKGKPPLKSRVTFSVEPPEFSVQTKEQTRQIGDSLPQPRHQTTDIQPTSIGSKQVFDDRTPLVENAEGNDKKMKKKKKKQKKDKEKKRRDQSKERQTSMDEKELNINIPERDSKPELDKHFSDEDNEVALHRRRSRSPEPRAFFFRPPVPQVLHVPSPTKSTLERELTDMGDEPDGESEEEEKRDRPPRPQRRLSRGVLNMLSTHSELRGVVEDDEQSENSDFEFHRRPPQSPHHKQKKDHQKDKKGKKKKKEKKKSQAGSSGSQYSDPDTA